jgi:hypothetical protein
MSAAGSHDPNKIIQQAELIALLSDLMKIIGIADAKGWFNVTPKPRCLFFVGL